MVGAKYFWEAFFQTFKLIRLPILLKLMYNVSKSIVMGPNVHKAISQLRISMANMLLS